MIDPYPGEKSRLIKRLVNSDYSHPIDPPGRLPAATPEVVALLSGFIDSLPYTPCESLNCAEPCSRCGPRDNSCAAENKVRRCSASRQCETTSINSCVAQTRATLLCADEFPDDRFIVAEQAEELCQELYGNTALMTASPSFSSCNAELFLGRDTILCLAAAEGVELIGGNYVLELFAEAVEPSFNIQTVRQRARALQNLPAV